MGGWEGGGEGGEWVKKDWETRNRGNLTSNSTEEEKEKAFIEEIYGMVGGIEAAAAASASDRDTHVDTPFLEELYRV